MRSASARAVHASTGHQLAILSALNAIGDKETMTKARTKNLKPRPPGSLIRPMSRDEMRQLKYKLNLGSAPFPKCQHKSTKALRALKAKGDLSHHDKKHAACKICGCKLVAGTGTGRHVDKGFPRAHYGWGWCYMHEKKKGPEKSTRMAEQHLIGLQQRHPKEYYMYEELRVDLVKKGDDAENHYDLPSALKKVHAINGAFLDMFQVHQENLRDSASVVKALRALTEAIKDEGSIPEQQWLEIVEHVGYIRTKLTCPLTEVAGGVLVEMSDKTRLTLAGNQMLKLASADKIVWDMLKEQWYTTEAYNIWFKRLVQRFDEEFGESTYLAEDGDRKIVEGLMECIKEAREPQKGT